MVSAMYDKIMGFNPKRRKTEIRHAYVVHGVIPFNLDLFFANDIERQITIIAPRIALG